MDWDLSSKWSTYQLLEKLIDVEMKKGTTCDREFFKRVSSFILELANLFPDPAKQHSPVAEELWNCKMLTSELCSTSELFWDSLAALTAARQEHSGLTKWDGDGGSKIEVDAILESISIHESRTTALFKLIYFLGHQVFSSACLAFAYVSDLNESEFSLLCRQNPETVSKCLLSERQWLDKQFNWIFETFVVNSHCGMTMDKDGSAFLVLNTSVSVENDKLAASLIQQVPLLDSIQGPLIHSKYDKALRAMTLYDKCADSQKAAIENILPRIGCITPSVDELEARLLYWLLNCFCESSEKHKAKPTDN